METSFLAFLICRRLQYTKLTREQPREAVSSMRTSFSESSEPVSRSGPSARSYQTTRLIFPKAKAPKGKRNKDSGYRPRAKQPHPKPAASQVLSTIQECCIGPKEPPRNSPLPWRTNRRLAAAAAASWQRRRREQTLNRSNR